MNKKISSLLCALGLSVTTTNFVSADSTNISGSNYDLELQNISEDSITIKFDCTSLDLPYNIEDITIDRKDYDNKIEFTVKDNNTNKILLVFGEETLKTEENVYIK